MARLSQLSNLNVNPLKNPIIFRMPLRDLPSAWMEHIPFALYLMDLLRPESFVELGTFYGVSYCAFCQAVKELELSTRCYAVDTWAGDAHTGPYQSEVLESLHQHHDTRYGEFSTLIQSTFDEAVEHFEDGSIDLLHIDGYHTYEGVKHDLETWKHKLSSRAVILFHDTFERAGDFGVWKLWEELKIQYPHFEFVHGHGLGVIAFGKNVPSSLLPLLNASEDETGVIREFFYEMGQRIALITALAEKNQIESRLRSDLQEVEVLKKTLAFRILMRLRNMAGWFFPKGSRRRKLYSFTAIRVYSLAISLKPENVKQTFDKGMTFWKRNGSRPLARKIWLKVQGNVPYFFKKPKRRQMDKKSAEKILAKLDYKPVISVVMPTYNTPVRYLKAAIKSVQAQYYPHWELCICDDSSTNPSTLALLKSIDDKRIKVNFLEKNCGISGATNWAVESASGEFVAPLDHDDELLPDALLEIVGRLNEQPDLDVIYSDQDKIDPKGKRSEPFFKPDWSPEYLLAVMYIGHLLVLRRELFNQIGGMNTDFDGVQDYELMLRVAEQTSKIAHIPKILYHWRKIPGSVALGLDEKGEKIERLQAQAVNEHLKRIGFNAEASRHPVHRHRAMLAPKPRVQNPKVSIVIVTKDAPEQISRCLASIVERTTYRNYEIIVVDNGTTDLLAQSILRRYQVKLVPFNQPFNYSKANNLGVNAAGGEIIVLLNNDTEVISPDWLEQMLLYLDDPGVAAVGPMLLYPDQTIQHAGIVLGLRGTADHVMRGYPHTSDGYAGSLSCPRNVSVVTGACLMTRREDYLNFGGLVEYYGTHYQDVDLCLRFLSAGKRMVYVPYAVLIHYEGATRGKRYDHLDRALLLDTWGELIASGDPYYNPNFSLHLSDYIID
jgi:GT2 family glycosyltransferase